MERKIIFLDVDGTLTTLGSNTPPKTAIRAISLARRNGHLIYLSSGRNYGMLQELLQYRFDGVICSAGGYIRCGEEVIFDCPLEDGVRARAMKILEEYGVFFTLECLEKAYSQEELTRILAEDAGGSQNSELLRWREAVKKDKGILPVTEYQGEPVYKIVVMSSSREKLLEAYELLKDDFELCLQDHFSQGAFVNAELISRKFNKGTAIEKVCHRLEIPLENSIAFGDSMNDKEMLETAGIGVCMEDGCDELKKIADGICPSANADGIYRSFVKYRVI